MNNIVVHLVNGEKFIIDASSLTNITTEYDMDSMLSNAEPFIKFNIKDGRTKVIIKSQVAVIDYKLPKRKEV